jgi:BED zinc finger
MASQTQNKRSKVWANFEMKSDDKVKCRICSLELAFHNSTTAMMQHLMRKHPWAMSDSSR